MTLLLKFIASTLLLTIDPIIGIIATVFIVMDMENE